MTPIQLVWRRMVPVWTLLALTIPVASTAPRPETRVDLPTARWREGPVRYIITAEEDRECKQLVDDESRRRFIERFWMRRDPDTRTLLNEYRQEFWNRVASANRLFAESSKPGWKTDMGRHYILLGPPDDRDTTLELAAGLGRTGVRGTITWRYSHAPTPRVGTGLSIVFTRDASGEFRTETDPRIVQSILDSTLMSPLPSLTDFGIPVAMIPPRLTELELMLDLGRLDEVPTEEDLLKEIISAEDFYGVIPFSARYDFFAGPDRATIVAMTLSIHPDPLDPSARPLVPDYLIVGRIDPVSRDGGVSSGASRPSILVREHDFSPSPQNDDPSFRGPYLYQAVAALPPGAYRVSFAAFDRARHKTGSYSDQLDVPSFEENTLTLSSLCLSDAIEPVGPDAASAPYVIGHLKVTPRLIPSYRNGETFAVYYQVYSAVNDPATQAPNLQIEYQFFVNQGGTFVAIGRPIRFDSVGNSAQGWSFPLRDWPTADFRLRVTVTDTLTGQVASREIAFKVL